MIETAPLPDLITIAEMKVCKACGQPKARKEFPAEKGLVCKPCWADRMRKWRRENIERVTAKQKEANRRRKKNKPSEYYRERWKASLKTRYGIGIEKYEEMLIAQDGRCGICAAQVANDRNLDVDHDHSTGEVRGLLCTRCNQGVGFLEWIGSKITIAQDYLRGIKCQLK